MNRIFSISLVLLLAVAFSLSIGGIANAQVKQGMNEVSLSGALDVVSADGESATATTIEVGYGRFFSQNFEIGGNASFVKLEEVDAFGTAGGWLAYHLGSSPTATMVPYVGGGVGVGYGNPADNPIIYEAFGGAKFFVAKGAAISVEPFFKRFSLTEGSYSNYGVGAGVSLFF